MTSPIASAAALRAELDVDPPPEAQAEREGLVFDPTRHADPDFAPLRDDAGYRAWLRRRLTPGLAAS